jgi:hypothetical protein
MYSTKKQAEIHKALKWNFSSMKWLRYQRVISLKIQVGIISQINKWANTGTGCSSLVIVLSFSIREVVSSSPARAGRVKPNTF